MLVYLSGSIEYAPDGGSAWRAEITPWLESLGYRVYDPAADRRKNLTEDEQANFRRWKTSDPERFRSVLRKIIAWDLDLIEHRCDCVIALWDCYAQRGAGSQGEITVAHRRGIPVYLVLGMPWEEVSGWILGCATRVFCGFAELRAWLTAEQALTGVADHHGLKRLQSQ